EECRAASRDKSYNQGIFIRIFDEFDDFVGSVLPVTVGNGVSGLEDAKQLQRFGSMSVLGYDDSCIEKISECFLNCEGHGKGCLADTDCDKTREASVQVERAEFVSMAQNCGVWISSSDCSMKYIDGI